MNQNSLRFFGITLGLIAAGTSSGCVTPSGTPGGTAVADGAVAGDTKASGGDGTSVGADGAVAADAAVDTAKPVPAGPIVDLVVDGNRDGVPNPADKDDQDFESVFDDKHGASFLANLDDDDNDQLEDFYDQMINGKEDVLDLAPVMLQPWKNAPDGTVVKLTIDNPKMVRVWAKLPDDQWGLLLGAFDTCDTADNCNEQAEANLGVDLLRSGLQLGIEAKQFRMSLNSGWNGELTVKLAVTDAAGKPIEALGAEAGVDTVKLRVAPWLLLGNTSEFDHWRSLDWGNQANTKVFNADLVAADAEIANADYSKYGWYSDQWTQDWYQTGLTQIPAAGGKVQGMRVYNARPFKNGGKDLPIVTMRKNMLGPDRAILAVYKKAPSGSSFDSHGNHDLLPPYENGAAKYPYGRIITGSGVLPETWEWYDAQKVQGPTLKVTTNWLAVGHVDEILSYAPAKTARGWKLLHGDDALAKAMFEKLAKDGHGDVEVFAGQTVKLKGATIKDKVYVKTVLLDQDLLQSSQTAHVKTEAAVEIVKKAVGLDDTELVSIPFLTEDFGSGEMISWQPGTVNSLVVYDYIMIPKPFGPIVNNVDVFAKDLEDRVGGPVNALGSDGKGMKVKFINDWYGYHLLMGEVHCGTNPEGPPNPKLKWWTMELK